jgi:hypothetical protein
LNGSAPGAAGWGCAWLQEDAVPLTLWTGDFSGTSSRSLGK